MDPAPSKHAKHTEAWEQVRLRHIFSRNLAKIQRVYDALIRSGQPSAVQFARAARRFSDCPTRSSGGELGWCLPGSFIGEFEGTAFSLPIGVVSSPVRSWAGFHLLYVQDKAIRAVVDLTTKQGCGSLTR